MTRTQETPAQWIAAQVQECMNAGDRLHDAVEYVIVQIEGYIDEFSDCGLPCDFWIQAMTQVYEIHAEDLGL